MTSILVSRSASDVHASERAKLIGMADDAIPETGADPTPQPETSSEELLEQIAGGDRTAFAQLYDRLSARVFGLVKRLLRDHSQSEEVTQEIFLEIWQGASNYDHTKGGAISWILTMTHRRAVDRIRASQASRDRDTRIGIRDWEPTSTSSPRTSRCASRTSASRSHSAGSLTCSAKPSCSPTTAAILTARCRRCCTSRSEP